MHVHTSNGWWMASRITGGDDHFLGVRFGTPGDLAGIDGRVAAEVQRAVDQTNAERGTALAVAAIKVAPDARFSRAIYARLAVAIATQAVAARSGD